MSVNGESPPAQGPPNATEIPGWLQTFLQQQATQQQQFLSQQQGLLEALSLRGSDAHTTPATAKIKSLPIPKLGSPESLSIPQFRDWKQRWKDYADVDQLSKRPYSTQQSVLRSALDSEWTLLFTSQRIPVYPSHNDDDIIVLMEHYLRERRNPLLDRQEFHRRDQAPGESIDRYYAALKILDDACAHEEDIRCSSCSSLCSGKCSNDDCEGQLPLYHHLQETRIRDRFICGLQDKETRTKILAEQYNSTLSLEKVLSICAAHEHSRSADASLRSQGPPSELHATSRQSNYKKQQSQGSSHPPKPSTADNVRPSSSSTSAERNWLQHQFPRNTCLRCGKITRHTESAPCPALDKRCTYFKCGKIGHIIDVCGMKLRHQSTPTANTIELSHPSPSATTPFELLNINTNNELPLLTIESQINNRCHDIDWLCDTGAGLDAIGLFAVETLGPEAVRSISSTKIEAVGPNGISLGPVGTICLILRHGDRIYKTIAGVYKHLTRPLLSKSGCIALGLIHANWPQNTSVNAISAPSVTRILEDFSVAPPEQIKHSLLQEYAAAFDDSTLRPMAGPPMSIELIDGATPFKRFRHNNIPYHWRAQVKQQLDEMVSKGIIEAVPVGEAIDWCHPMVVVPKKNSHEPRLTIDLTKLNQYVRRPAYPMRIPREAVARIPPGQQYFTTLDARHGYWQVPLDEPSRKLTTFITPWGCYRYLRNVMGLISAGDEHNRRGDEALSGIENVEKVVEDIVIYDTDLETHVSRVRQVIQRCLEHGITLNKSKFNFAQSSAQWCGYILTPEGYTLAPHLIEALKRFPIPASKTDVRSFNGLVQQFATFSHRISELASPLRALLPANACFTWTQAHQHAFEQIIAEFSSPSILAHFQPGKPLRLETDAAQSKGLGFALWQQQVDSTWRLLCAGSRFASDTESRYSATEIEFLAVVWAVQKCRLFLLGHPFELLVDHRPLVSIINSKTLDEIDNPRLLRFKEKIGMYLIHATWRAGSKHTVVDVLSRYPVLQASDSETINLDIDPAQVFATSLCDPDTRNSFIPDRSINGIREAANVCPAYQKLMSFIVNGFPEKSLLDEDITPFWNIRHDLSIIDNLVFWGCRIVIPTRLRRHILHLLHASHQGQERTLRRARQAVYWPGITNDIKNIVNTCRPCQTFLPSSPKEPLLQDTPPTFPFQEVGADLFTYAGYEYLIMVDRFSGWITVCKVGHSATTANVIQILKQFMTDSGIPELLRTDNGPQFSSFEFKEWADRWGIQLKSSSPHYPQSNGLAESAVKAIKHLLAKTSPKGDINCDAFRLGLLELRNTPGEDGQSPALLLFGHPLRSLIPLHRSRFRAEWSQRRHASEAKASKIRSRIKDHYDSRAHPLQPLSIGDIVLIQNHASKRWDLLGEVIELVNERSYLVRTEAGRVLRRNRRFLRTYHTDIYSAPMETTSSEPPSLRRSPRNHPSSVGGFRLKGGVDTGPSTSRTSEEISMHHSDSGARQDRNDAFQHQSG